MMYQATGYFEQNAHYVSADVSEADYQFATEPLAAVKLAEQQVSEEELLSSFEQAVSDRMEAIGACSNLVSGPLTHQPHTIGDREGPISAQGFPAPQAGHPIYGMGIQSPRQGSTALPNVPAPLVPARGAGIWSSLLSNRWQRGIILVSLALLLLMSGFDLMGVLILHMR